MVGVGFASREDRANDPLVFVVDDDASSDTPTYIGTRDVAGVWGTWQDSASGKDDGVFHVQAICSEN